MTAKIDKDFPVGSIVKRIFGGGDWRFVRVLIIGRPKNARYTKGIVISTAPGWAGSSVWCDLGKTQDVKASWGWALCADDEIAAPEGAVTSGL